MSVFQPISEEATKYTLNQATKLLEKVTCSFRTGKIDENSFYEFFKLSAQIRSSNYFKLILAWHYEQILNFVNAIKADLQSNINLEVEEQIKLISKYYSCFQIFVVQIKQFLLSIEDFLYKTQLWTTVFKKSFEYFRKEFEGLKEIMIEKIFKLIEKARTNYVIPNEELSRVIQIIIDLDFKKDIKIERDLKNNELRVISDSSTDNSKNYIQLFKNPFLEKTKNHFQKLASLWAGMNDVEYFNLALQYIKREEEICYPLLINNTKETIMDALQLKSRLQLYYQQKIFKPVFESAQKKITDYQSEEKNKAYSKKNFRDLNQKIATEWVHDLIQTKKYVEKQIPNEDLLFNLAHQEAIDKTFQYCLTEFKNASQLLLLYCDYFMKQNLSDEEYERRQADFNTIFVYMQSKDEFLQYYQQALCKRLICFNFKSIDAEYKMVTQFKNSIGVHTTVIRFQNMLTDLKINEQYNKEKFQNDVLKIYILSSVAWPLLRNEQDNIIFPSSFVGLINQFTYQYNQIYNKRKIYWLLNEGSAEINFISDNMDNFGGKYILRTTSYQMLILMKMNEKDQFTVKDLMDQTGINKYSFDSNLKQLIKLKILNCSENDKYTEFSEIKINTQFYSTKKSILCLPHASVSTQQDDSNISSIQTTVEQERTQIIKAYLVKIMKIRKVMAHNDLIKECVELIKKCSRTFEPCFLHIKNCIENLIEQEYIKRIENDYKKYQYVQ
ncbi:cullin family protein (macronuclear) [Tetrahymena thermophila SB210]|uniref:Cullin family protein n=1 Tax=Tetrahymena thermophila (strain SB210) TaxID=312017 RepID=Q24CG0_TETTS|nr:cullin family protein [Tetrahymena thermophila SB210]EAS05500.2 cullin family protein [Tetrahymena thermophila SB210]|eukprot:XP_001025745.2 cullin family protein [Tetrahymena thermophila SB210]